VNQRFETPHASVPLRLTEALFPVVLLSPIVSPYLVFSMGGDAQQDVRVAAAREEFIARIDCPYVKSKGAKTSTGFQVTEQGEPPPLPEPAANGDEVP